MRQRSNLLIITEYDKGSSLRRRQSIGEMSGGANQSPDLGGGRNNSSPGGGQISKSGSPQRQADDGTSQPNHLISGRG